MKLKPRLAPFALTAPLLCATVVAFVGAASRPAFAAPAQKRASQSQPETRADAERHHNALFGYTHLAPSPFTLRAGTLVFGTEIAYGLTDFLQVRTQVLRDVYGFFNAQAKVSLVDYPSFAFGTYLGWESYSLKTIDDSLEDRWVTSWLPGGTAAVALVPEVAVFFGGNLRFGNMDLDDGVDGKSGYARGAIVFSEISWAYNPEGRSGGVGNVLAAGATYDITYEIYGVGLSHHWPGFHVGIHYYPNADRYRVQPILAGGGSMQF